MPNLYNRIQNSPNFKHLLNSTPWANIYSLVKQFINHQYSELFYLNIVYSGNICNLTMTYNCIQCSYIKFNSYDSLPLGKTLTLHNVIILIKSVFSKDQNRYYFNVFLERFKSIT